MKAVAAKSFRLFTLGVLFSLAGIGCSLPSFAQWTDTGLFQVAGSESISRIGGADASVLATGPDVSAQSFGMTQAGSAASSYRRYFLWASLAPPAQLQVKTEMHWEGDTSFMGTSFTYINTITHWCFATNGYSVDDSEIVTFPAGGSSAQSVQIDVMATANFGNARSNAYGTISKVP
jgi:hypothetical protein